MNVGDHYLALSDLKFPVNIRRTQSQENFLETHMSFQLCNSPCGYCRFVVSNSERSQGNEVLCTALRHCWLPGSNYDVVYIL